MKICNVDGCTLRAHVRGWCNTHYLRITRNGSPDGPMPIRRGYIMGLPTRFWAKVVIDLDSGCWEWTASKQRVGHGRGYGIFNVNNRGVSPHRLTYKALVGSIPDDLEIDHLCRNRGCCNPEHLEAVTHAENMARSAPALQTHCKHGHEFNDANTYRAKNGTRNCRRCHANQERSRKAKARQ